jgi:Asp-tRNA(Asn)/Glu-tRNA(Gln) amidotransferase A subunit family amidase
MRLWAQCQPLLRHAFIGDARTSTCDLQFRAMTFAAELNRRKFLAVSTTFGVAHTLFPGALMGLAEAQAAAAPDKDKKEPAKITRQMIDDAATIAGVHISDEYKEMMLENLNDALKDYDAIHDLHIKNSVAPALIFQPILPGMKIHAPSGPTRLSDVGSVATPKNIEDVAFYTVRQLGELVRTKRVSSTALTEMYLERLKRYDPILKFVVTLTTDRAMAQAREADKEIAAGKYRGPLHGLPWGAKDLLAVKGYKTTWGAGGFEDQVIDEDATVVHRLDQAGAVLIAKLTLGALAMGDVWFGGTTKNPWKTDQGSSGSSAGSASATAAGCVAFGIGTETLGSISSPSTRCGTTGLRPTFGRVPRTGAMALCWTMDKIGPICRAVEDCAVVLEAIQGPDGKDSSVNLVPFSWNSAQDLHKLRIGFLQDAFNNEIKTEDDDEPDKKRMRERRMEQKKFDDAALQVLTGKLGQKLIPVKLPDFPFDHLLPILTAEAGAAFDELTRSGRDKLLTAQTKDDWPNTFRSARFIPAIEYINANRARVLAMQQMSKLFEQVDVIVCPTNGTSQLVATNFTGQPAIILPNGFRADGTPTSLTFLGTLYREDQVCAVAKAYQDATEWNKRHPLKIEKAPEKEKEKS